MWKLVRFNPTTRKDEAVITGFKTERLAVYYLYAEYPLGVFCADAEQVYRCVIVKGALEHYYRIEEDAELKK